MNEDERAYFDIEEVASMRYTKIDDEVFTREVEIDTNYESSYLARQSALQLLQKMKEAEIQCSTRQVTQLDSRTTHTKWMKETRPGFGL